MKIKYSISIHYDIEETSISNLFYRYRLITTSKKLRYLSFLYLYRPITISKKFRYRSQKLRYWYIPISKCFSISIKAISISMYDVEALRFDIECCIPRYLCFCLGCCSPCSVLDTYCRVNYSLRIKRLACGLRLWNRLTRTSRSQESPRPSLEMPLRSGPLKPRLTIPPCPRLAIPSPRGESVA